MPMTRAGHLSRAHRAKISAALQGHPVSAETRAKLSAAAMGNQASKGRKVSRLTRLKIGAAKKGNTYTRGLKRPVEWCQATSERMRGNKNRLGKKDSAATIARKRGSMLARHGVVVLPSPAPGVMGYAPDYKVNRVVFFRP